MARASNSGIGNGQSRGANSVFQRPLPVEGPRRQVFGAIFGMPFAPGAAMRRFLSAILIAFVIASSSIPARASGASGIAAPHQGEAATPSLIVLPVADGDCDAQSAEIARALADGMRLVSDFHIIDSKLAANVLEYHGGGDNALKPGAGEEALSRAKEDSFAFRYDRAQARLDLALSILEKRPEELSKSGATLLDAYVTGAVIARARGDGRKAAGMLLSALKINPRLDLAAQEYPPSLVKALEDERSKLFSGGTGTLAVRTRPDVAEVWINGVKHGVTPLEVELPAGGFRLMLRANRYGDTERELNIPAGGRVDVKEKLGWRGGVSKDPLGTADPKAEVAEGLRIAELMNADKAVLVDAYEEGGEMRFSARMVDRRMRVGQRPLLFDSKGGATSELLARMTAAVSSQAGADLATAAVSDVEGLDAANPILISKRKKPLTRRPAFWAVVGVVVAGALGGGLAAAFSGGSGDRGSLRVEFR